MPLKHIKSELNVLFLQLYSYKLNMIGTARLAVAALVSTGLTRTQPGFIKQQLQSFRLTRIEGRTRRQCVCFREKTSGYSSRFYF